MRQSLLRFLALPVLLLVPAAYGQAQTFVASTPCDDAPRPFLDIPRNEPCERVSWQLELSPGTTAGAFVVRVTYGMTVPNTRGLRDGGRSAEFTGEWVRVERDLRLTRAGTPKRTLLLRTIDDNLLHLLDDRGRVLVGNAGWSYVLNRREPVTRAAEPEPAAAVKPGPVPTGVFDGRTPCDVLPARLGLPRAADCFKIKWRLRVNRDRQSGKKTYALEATAYRERPRTGTWTTEPSTTHPGASVVRLDAGPSGAFLSFLQLDDNVLLFLDANDRPLVGNDEFSYAVNRTRK